MKWLLVFILFLFSLGQTGRVSVPGFPAYFYLYELFFFPAVLMWIVSSGREKMIAYASRYKYTLLFISVLGVSLLMSIFFYKTSENLVAFLYFFRLCIYFAWTMLVIDIVKASGIHARFFTVMVWCYVGGLFASALLQYWFYPNFGNIAYLGWDPHMERLVGIFFEPPVAASVYGLSGFSLLFFYRKKRKALALAAAVFLGVMLFFTYSRLVMIAFTITLLFFLIRTHKYVVLPAFIVMALLLFALPQGTHESINLYRVTSVASRKVDIQKGLQIVQKNPFSGIGYNHIRFEKDKLSEEPLTETFNPSHSSSSFHNSFLIILVAGGVVGLGCFLLWLTEIARISTYHAYMILFLSLASMGDNVLLHPFIMFLFPLLGAYFVITHHGDRSP